MRRGLHALPTDPEERFLEVFHVAARQAGALAVRLQGEVAYQEKPGQTSPEATALTAADLAAQDVILLLLRAVFDDLAVDAEEDTPLRERFEPPAPGRPLLVVDPIDGSLNYSRGSEDFAVMGGWLRQGRFRAALIHFPVWRQTWWARDGHGAWRQDGDGAPAPARPTGPRDRVLVTPRLGEDRTERLRRAGFTVAVSRCSAVDATAPVTGRAAAAVATGPSSRRRPCGLYVTHCAGGAVLVGGRAWAGEDPVDRIGPDDLVVCATDAALAERIDEILRRSEP